jgi:hypothetical protein
VPASASQNVRFEIPLINASNYVSESRNLLKTSTNSTCLVTIVFVQDISYLYATRAPRHPRQFLNSLSVQKYSIDLCFCCMHFHPSPDLRPYSKNFPIRQFHLLHPTQVEIVFACFPTLWTHVGLPSIYFNPISNKHHSGR